MRKRTFLITLLLILPMVLAACGGFDTGEFEDAYTKALEDGDVDDINELLCEDEQLNADEFSGETGISINEFNCEVDGDDLSCDYTVEIADFGEQSGTITATIEDGVACDFQDTADES